MKKTTKYALAFAALAGLAGTAAVASDHFGGERWGHQMHGKMYGHHMRDGDMRGPGSEMRMGEMFDKADADKSGDVSFEEFAAAMNSRIGLADADKDGKFTVAEIADAIVKMRAERAAEMIVKRFDTDGDGTLSAEEVEKRQKKFFAMLDDNDDGKVEKSELAKRHGFGFPHWGDRGPGPMHHGPGDEGERDAD
ncbi:MAG: EF-hand domain-containing protein [Notoacmeibacter sp.]|nr:EF-hand domain-containing protein [Notoacmeibacter sp.]